MEALSCLNIITQGLKMSRCFYLISFQIVADFLKSLKVLFSQLFCISWQYCKLGRKGNFSLFYRPSSISYFYRKTYLERLLLWFFIFGMSCNKVTVTISTNLFLVLAVQYQTRRKIAKISLCKVKNFIIPKLRKVVMIYKILK